MDFRMNAFAAHDLMQRLNKTDIADECRSQTKFACLWFGIANGQGLDLHMVIDGGFKQVGMKQTHRATFAAGTFWKSSNAIAMVKCT